MNAEESLILAVLDSPKDEDARLVYADWLEERGDPRGELLRIGARLKELERRGGYQDLRAQAPRATPFDLSRQREGWELQQRRAELLRQADVRWAILMGERLVGEVVRGVVRGLSADHAHIDFGGLPGTIRFDDPLRRASGPVRRSEIPAIGLPMDVVVREVSQAAAEISLKLDPLREPSPAWERALAEHRVGGIVVGTLGGWTHEYHEPSRIVRLGSGVEGRIHRTQMHPAPARWDRPAEAPDEGTTVTAAVLDFEPRRELVHLSMISGPSAPDAGGT